MKNVKTITLLATLVASTLSGPAMLAGGDSLVGNVFSAETGKNLCKYVGLPASSYVTLKGLAGMFKASKSPSLIPAPYVTTSRTQAAITFLGILGSKFFYDGMCYFAYRIQENAETSNKTPATYKTNTKHKNNE